MDHLDHLSGTDRQIAEQLANYVVVSPTLTNRQMRRWLDKHHGIPEESVRADDIISAVRNHYRERGTPINTGRCRKQ